MFTADFKPEPYWWDGIAPHPFRGSELPKQVDVLVIGSGYTGLHAALQTARGGRETLVLDAERAGWGCSTRNGGQISTSIKPSLEDLKHRYGSEMGLAMRREGPASLEWIEEFVRDEGLDCDFNVVGRFYAAHTPKHYENLAKEVAEKPVPGLETDAYMVPRSEQHRELASDLYHGGAVYPRHASLHPAKYHRGLLDKVLVAGANVVSQCRVNGLERDANGFVVQTQLGSVRARKVVIATNGYTGPLTPWHQRRVIPIGSYVIATEPIAPEVMDRLLPTNRNIVDTRKLVVYYRASPDRTRILFGGRVSISESDPVRSAPKMRQQLIRLFPELSEVRLSHSWMGFVAYTFDELMHVGEEDGLFYSMGYCGSGVGLASYLGMRVGKQVLGQKDGYTPLSEATFSTRPFYSGTPWFLAPSVLYYSIRDRMGI